ncbi:amidohydrolase family protein [Microbacterium sp. A196]|uniref:amidohydrolase family protein n=1 Tax=unclassified Microbacterium TaxID=2609290 RepID=UPI003FD512CF
MPVIDAQVHCFEANTPARPWTGPGAGLPHATAQTNVDLMDENGVDSAVLVSPSLNYGTDATYAFEAAEAHPGRFAVIVPIDLARQHPEDLLDEISDRKYVAGLRHMLWTPEQRAALNSLRLDALWRGMVRAGLPLCVATRGETAEIAELAGRFPELTIVIDHLGLPSSPTPPAPENPFTLLGTILQLAPLPNIAVKITGMPALSHERYPFADLHDAMHRTVDAFGAERVMWGTDWTRVHEFADYAAGVQWMLESGLDADELRLVRGESAARIFTGR